MDVKKLLSAVTLTFSICHMQSVNLVCLDVQQQSPSLSSPPPFPSPPLPLLASPIYRLPPMLMRGTEAPQAGAVRIRLEG